MTQTMTTAEATVASLVAHGIETVYALPGIQNDHLFDALYKASDRIKVSIPATSRARPIWRWAPRSPPARPQAYAVVQGPGLLNTGAALLTAYAMNAPVLGLIGRDPGRRHRARHRPVCTKSAARPASSPAGRLFRAHRRAAGRLALVGEGGRRDVASRRRGPAVLECAIDVWGRSGPAPLQAPLAAGGADHRRRRHRGSRQSAGRGASVP